MYLMCTRTHASNLMTARLQLETLSRESLSTCINLVKSQACVLNSLHWWFKSKFTALPSFLKRKKKTCNKINDHLCLHFCWCISASKIISTYSEVRNTFLITISSGLPSRLGFCAQLCTQFVKCLYCVPLTWSQLTTAAEDTQMSRARERQGTIRCVTTVWRRPSSNSELCCAHLVVEQEKVADPMLPGQTTRATLK